MTYVYHYISNHLLYGNDKHKYTNTGHAAPNTRTARYFTGTGSGYAQSRKVENQNNLIRLDLN
jgi:hypothetical protein